MNILLPFETMKTAAALLTDVHARKQAIECMQMAAVGCAEHGLPLPLRLDGGPYKLTHTQHPVTRWVCRSPAHIVWTLQYARRCAIAGKSLRVLDCVEELLAKLPKRAAIKEFIFLGSGYKTIYGDKKTVASAYRTYLTSEKGYTSLPAPYGKIQPKDL